MSAVLIPVRLWSGLPSNSIQNSDSHFRVQCFRLFSSKKTDCQTKVWTSRVCPSQVNPRTGPLLKCVKVTYHYGLLCNKQSSLSEIRRQAD